MDTNPQLSRKKVVSIQLELFFGKMAAAVHRNGKTRIYHNLSMSSWWRVMDTAIYAKSSREGACKGREYQFYYI